jgi:hypothetical protein
MRLEEEPDQDKEFASQEELQEAFIPFNVPLFHEDNRFFFYIVHSLWVNGPNITWIKKCETTRNGRKAWLKLAAQYEGDGKRTRTRVTARASVQKAEYRGTERILMLISISVSTLRAIFISSNVDNLFMKRRRLKIRFQVLLPLTYKQSNLPWLVFRV